MCALISDLSNGWQNFVNIVNIGTCILVNTVMIMQEERNNSMATATQPTTPQQDQAAYDVFAIKLLLTCTI